MSHTEWRGWRRELAEALAVTIVSALIVVVCGVLYFAGPGQ